MVLKSMCAAALPLSSLNTRCVFMFRSLYIYPESVGVRITRVLRSEEGAEVKFTRTKGW